MALRNVIVIVLPDVICVVGLHFQIDMVTPAAAAPLLLVCSCILNHVLPTESTTVLTSPLSPSVAPILSLDIANTPTRPTVSVLVGVKTRVVPDVPLAAVPIFPPEVIAI